MRKRIFLLMLLVTITGYLKAQSDNSSSNYTLQQAIDYALKNQSMVQNATLDQEIAQAKIGEIRAAGLPQINGAAQFTHYGQLREMFIPGSSPIVQEIAPGINPNSVLAMQPFQTKNLGDISVSASQLIFDGSYFTGLKAAKVYTDLSYKNLKQTKIQTVEIVSKAYYLVLINKERLTLLDANIQRVDSLLKQTKIMYDNGFAEKIEVDRVEVTYNNLVTEKQKLNNLYYVSEAMLKYQMGMPMKEDIVLSQHISEFNVPVDANAISMDTSTANYDSRIEYSLLKTQKRLQELDLKVIQMRYLPKLSAVGSLGTYNGSNQFEYFSNAHVTYYNYNMIGLNLNVPIFDGFMKAYQVRQARLILKKTENSFTNLQNSIDYQVAQSKANLVNGIQSLNVQKRNMDLASDVARVTKIKYQQGVGSNLEVVTAENALKESQVNYYSALYDVLVGKIDYSKSTGTLYSE